VATLGTIYCDEAGFTGNNLLDDEQEVFAFSSVAIEPKHANDIVEGLIKNFKLNSGEIKGSRLLNSANGREAITSVLKTLQSSGRITTHMKKFALACKFFEYIFEPSLARQSSIFYEAGFHLYVSTLLFVHFRSSDQTAEALFENFSTLMRKGDQAALQNLFPSKGLIVDYRDDPIQALPIFAMLNRKAIVEELEAIRSDGTKQNWILDLTTTSLFGHLCERGTNYDVLDVYCDNSKPLETHSPFFDVMVGREDRVELQMFGKKRPYTFNLKQSIQLVDSKNYAGIQLADVLASAAARVFSASLTGKVRPIERDWLTLMEPMIMDDVIWPDFENLDLDKRGPFVNTGILIELTERCLTRQDLFEGMPEHIYTLHEMYRHYQHEVLGKPQQT
jgi:hypothetical protein